MLTACKVVSAIRNGCYICYENRERAKFTARLKVCEEKKNYYINKKATYTLFVTTFFFLKISRVKIMLPVRKGDSPESLGW